MRDGQGPARVGGRNRLSLVRGDPRLGPGDLLGMFAAVLLQSGRRPAPPFAIRPTARGMIALGFILTLASTAASLVPAALTEPLIDDVLILHEKNGTGSFSLVGFYLVCMTVAWLSQPGCWGGPEPTSWPG